MDTITESLAAIVAPEDIRVGDYIAPMNDIDQFPMRPCDEAWNPGRPPRLVVATVKTVAYPRVLRVLAVALPYVLVEDVGGERQLVTVRLNEFARLPEEVGRLALVDLDRRRRAESAERRKARRARREQRRAAQDRTGAGAEGAD